MRLGYYDFPSGSYIKVYQVVMGRAYYRWNTNTPGDLECKIIEDWVKDGRARYRFNFSDYLAQVDI